MDILSALTTTNPYLIVAKAAGIALVVFTIWWFGIHNPKIIKAQEVEIHDKIKQIKARDAALNMLGEITKKQMELERQSRKNIVIIRNAPKPNRDSYFVLPGLLPSVFKAYTSYTSTPSNDRSAIQSQL